MVSCDPVIRTYREGDEASLYDVCLRTGTGGEDATRLYANGHLLGDVYVGPYVRLAPQFVFVLEDDAGVAGYVLGVPDTQAFETACEQQWWPPLRRRYPLSMYPEQSADGRMVRHIHAPPRTPVGLTASHPAHLHIDLLQRAQGRGSGRRLLTTLVDALATAGASGVHLGVGAANHRAIGFYRRMGFEELDRSADSLVMGRTLIS